MEKPRGKRAAGKISRRAQQCHCRHAASANPAIQEALTVPIKEAHAAQRADLEQRALHAPVARLAHTPGGIAIQVGRMFRHLFSSSHLLNASQQVSEKPRFLRRWGLQPPRNRTEMKRALAPEDLLVRLLCKLFIWSRGPAASRLLRAPKHARPDRLELSKLASPRASRNPLARIVAMRSSPTQSCFWIATVKSFRKPTNGPLNDCSFARGSPHMKNKVRMEVLRLTILQIGRKAPLTQSGVDRQEYGIVKAASILNSRQLARLVH